MAKKIEINIGFHKSQQAIVDLYNKHKYFVCCFGRRWGKTVMVTNLCILKIKKKGFKIAYCIPSFQKMKSIWDELNLKLAPLIKNNSKQDKIIELINGASIEFLTLDTPGSARSKEYDLVIIDECSLVRDLEYKWTYEIKPTLINRSGKCFFISTPQGNTNYFSKLYHNAISGTDKEWIGFTGPTFDNPTIPTEELIKLKNGDVNDPAYQQEILAQIIQGSGSPFGDINACLIDPGLVIDKTVVCYGIDLASRADFTSIIGLNKDKQICSYNNFQLPWPITKTKIREIVGDTPSIADRTGVGDVVISDLKQLGMHKMEEFVITHQSKQELIQGLATAIKNKLILIPNNLTKLIAELNEFEYEYRNGSLFFGTQPGHDDDVCALALCWFKFNNNVKYKSSDFIFSSSKIQF